MADGAVEELCRLAADFDLSYWTRIVSSQTCTLERVLERGVEDLLQKSIREKIRTMGLPRKMRHLLANAGKHSKVEYDVFTYDRARLAELDSLRHEIIHREGITRQVASRDSQEFFFNLTAYAGLVTSSMLGLDITYPQYYIEWFGYLKQQAGAGTVEL
jgi:hypothetical protein